MPREPGAYELATKTPIFVPNNQPAMSTYSGKNKKSKSKVYTDTHLNYLLGRDNSSLTMISTETEWKEAVNSNLICFGKANSLIEEKNININIDEMSYGLLDIGLCFKSNKSVGSNIVTKAKKTKALPTFIEVSVRGCCIAT